MKFRWVTREIKGKTIDIPFVDVLPDGMYKTIVTNREYTIYYSLSEREYYAVKTGDKT